MRRTWLFGLGVSMMACGASTRPAAHYDGAERPGALHPARVQLFEVLPEGYERTGRAVAECERVEGLTIVDDEWLSDLDCSTWRMQAALRKVAADAGSTALIGVRCFSRGTHTSDDVVRTPLHCQAHTAAKIPADTPASTPAEPEAPLAKPAGPPGADPELARWLDDPSAVQAWNIQVDFTPAVGVKGLRPRPSEAVNELAYLPPNRVELGDVITRCEQGCTEEGVRAGVRVVAGRLGASDVVGVRCVQNQTAWLCTGTAAVYAAVARAPRAAAGAKDHE